MTYLSTDPGVQTVELAYFPSFEMVLSTQLWWYNQHQTVSFFKIRKGEFDDQNVQKGPAEIQILKATLGSNSEKVSTLLEPAMRGYAAYQKAHLTGIPWPEKKSPEIRWGAAAITIFFSAKRWWCVLGGENLGAKKFVSKKCDKDHESWTSWHPTLESLVLLQLLQPCEGRGPQESRMILKPTNISKHRQLSVRVLKRL